MVLDDSKKERLDSIKIVRYKLIHAVLKGKMEKDLGKLILLTRENVAVRKRTKISYLQSKFENISIEKLKSMIDQAIKEKFIRYRDIDWEEKMDSEESQKVEDPASPCKN